MDNNVKVILYIGKQNVEAIEDDLIGQSIARLWNELEEQYLNKEKGNEEKDLKSIGSVKDCLKGLSEVVTRYQRRMYKKYERIAYVSNVLEHDLKHGVTKSEVSAFLLKVKTDPSFVELRESKGFMNGIFDIETSLG